ncbi:hypothetical protein [Sinorhizobium meliloti]|uniref:hypothetical protein n=1 Tax=Rhizobium meliloti TaxID=382 RepID=UPI0013E3CE6A|nr:hypothetical protein [Sinorhizobium meliloti]
MTDGSPDFAASDKIGSPICPSGCFQSEELAVTTYDHIQELRAELAASIDASERQQIAAELERAVAQYQQEKAAFDVLISVEPPH